MNAQLKRLAETITLPEDTYLEQDAEIFEIFIEEIEEILEELKELVPEWVMNQDDEALVTIRRYFHTLKGSGRMVGAKASGELAWTVESLLNNVISKNLELNADIQQYVYTVVNFYLYKLLPEFKANQSHALDFRPLVLIGQRLQHRETLETVLANLLELALTVDSPSAPTGLEDDGEEAEESEHSTVIPEIVPVQVVDERLFDRTGNEMLDIFLEESQDNLALIHKFLTKDRLTTDDCNKTVRAVHTLRGSSSMVGIEHITNVSQYVEKSLDELNQKLAHEELDEEKALLTDYVSFVELYLGAFKAEKPEQCQKYYEEFVEQWQLHNIHEQTISAQHGLVASLLDLGIELLLDAEFDFADRAIDEYPVYLSTLITQANALKEYPHTDSTIAIQHYSDLLAQAYQVVLDDISLVEQENVQDLFTDVHHQLVTLFDTLASGQGIEKNVYQNQVIQQLQEFIQQHQAQEIKAADLLRKDVDNTGIVQPSASATPSQSTALDLTALIAQMAQDRNDVNSDLTNRDFDADLLDIFLEEAEELLITIDENLNTWSQDDSNTSALNNLMRYLHTLKGGANMVQATNIGIISHELETIYQGVIAGVIPVSANLVRIVRVVQDELADRLQALKDDNIDYPATKTVEVLKKAIHGGSSEPVKTPTKPVVKEEKAPVVEQKESVQPPKIVEQPVAKVVEKVEVVEPVKLAPVVEKAPIVQEEPKPAPVATPVAPAPQKTSQSQMIAHDDMLSLIASGLQEKQSPVVQNIKSDVSVSDDALEDIIEYEFLDEASLLLRTAEELLPLWIDDRSNRNVLLRLQRTAHSLKGAARIAKYQQVSDIATQLEHVFEQFAVHQFNSGLYDDSLRSVLNWLKVAIFDKKTQDYEAVSQMLRTFQFTDIVEGGTVLFDENYIYDEIVVGDGTEPPSMMGEWDEANTNSHSGEMIRISTDVIEKMLDLSGENSINRSRIEMDLSLFSNTLGDMELTIKRLADQLRRMEGELETQILARHADDAGVYQDFDPLEMDKYSSLNQLSKSLAESASDLLDFKATLSDKIRETEGLLLQQSRIQSEIQESLMRTRLVPFAPMLPRLQRLIRQTSNALDKPVEFVTTQTEGEFDRNILEHLITPFEHMLRNAIDHGLETREERSRTLKPATGRVELKIERQGTDVVATLIDDGKGIDVRKIRRKAIQNGLMQEGEALERADILQFIFHHGFSTAQEVTQISGRGVGLDVVQSEIKELGGHISVDSVYGEGTTFTIRVPTTVAMSDALMVKHADQQFAIQLTQIDRIVRIEPKVLESYFKSKNEHLTIDLQSYRLRYLSELIADQPIPKFTDMETPLPVLLLKDSGGQRVALLVDQLIGSREQVVVKPIGEQFGQIGIIAGGTILGDGRVCLILDAVNIIRQIQSTSRFRKLFEGKDKARQRDQRHLIMIVDDSVTVRKVTTRLLERQGYDVITAKDGVDAMEKLETARPDLMLLDIEMPRMDGFEVTTLVRRHELHYQLPIIMITSRTGEKHRERALSLGVTQYMGKPYQEVELLDSIRRLLANTVGE